MAQAKTHYGFEDEVYFSLRRQRNIFGWLSLFGMLVALGSVGVLALMLPLKEIRPYVVMVDRETGQAEQLVQTRPADLSERETVRQSELVRYVSSRETYDVHDNHVRIPEVLKTSKDEAEASLRALWTAESTNYPPDLYGADTMITVLIRSIIQLDEKTAQVRFTRKLERPGLKAVERDFVATVGFEFRPRVERRLEDVWHNPLGFTVVGYRVDAETLDKRGEAK